MASSSPLRVIWLDEEVHSDLNKQFLADIHSIDPEAKLYTNLDECLVQLARGLADSRRFVFIVSGKLGESLVPKIHERKNIVSIYVYCAFISKHEGWSRQYEKVSFLLDYLCLICAYYRI